MTSLLADLLAILSATLSGRDPRTVLLARRYPERGAL